jgi:hypothetical protein
MPIRSPAANCTAAIRVMAAPKNAQTAAPHKPHNSKHAAARTVNPAVDKPPSMGAFNVIHELKTGSAGPRRDWIRYMVGVASGNAG